VQCDRTVISKSINLSSIKVSVVMYYVPRILRILSSYVLCPQNSGILRNRSNRKRTDKKPLAKGGEQARVVHQYRYIQVRRDL